MKRNNSLVFMLVVISSGFAVAGKELTIEDIWGSAKFTGKTIRGIQWMKDGRSYSFSDLDTSTNTTTVYVYDCISRLKRPLISGSDLKLNPDDPAFSFTSYHWSPDENQLLFISAPPAKQYLSRLTPAGNIFLYDLRSKQFSRITNVSVPQYNQKISPDGKKIGFVRENNLYLYDIALRKEIQITHDGTKNIINGKFDWVYEEEFGISDGWKWSPDGTWIAFWHFDQTDVPEYTMTKWDSTHGELISMKYPKPGDKNSIVKIGIFNTSTDSTIWLNLGTEQDIYIPRIQWSSEKNILSVQRLNRSQNTLELLSYDVVTGVVKPILTEQSETWVEVHDDLRFLKNGNFCWSSERDGYNHLYLFNKEGRLIKQVTRGEWDVDALYGIDEKDGTLYFTSSEVSPMERHIYSVTLDGLKKKQLSKLPGTHSASFSPGFEFYVSYYSNCGTPTEVHMMKKNGTEMYRLEENKISALKEYDLPLPSFITIVTSDGISLNGTMIKPVDFDSSKKYPVLIYTYGGPGSQIVKNSWGGSNYLWHVLLTQKGYIVFMVDNRGTGARGVAFKKIVYKNLGRWEVNDQIEGVKYLATLPFVDKYRIGIWGWSYGGYVASQTILLGADYLKTAIAVAPVINWKFYDTIYTERFMDTPRNNPEGYRESAPMNHASKLKGRFLLIHGSSDDNVHFQNTVNMVNALQKENKQFETMFYPNKNHGISGGKTRIHLYDLMTQFILKNL